MTFVSYESPSGPYSILFALATLYCIQVPCTDRLTILGIHFSDKIYTYLLCGQVCYDSNIDNNIGKLIYVGL